MHIVIIKLRAAVKSRRFVGSVQDCESDAPHCCNLSTHRDCLGQRQYRRLRTRSRDVVKCSIVSPHYTHMQNARDVSLLTGLILLVLYIKLEVVHARVPQEFLLQLGAVLSTAIQTQYDRQTAQTAELFSEIRKPMGCRKSFTSQEQCSDTVIIITGNSDRPHKATRQGDCSSVRMDG